MSKSVEYFLLAHEKYHEWVRSKVDLFRMMCRNLLLICLGSLSTPQREQLGSAAACSSSLMMSSKSVWVQVPNNRLLARKDAVKCCEEAKNAAPVFGRVS
jgi:hypothetical protein